MARILIIDDDDLARSILEQAFVAGGHEVVAQADSLTAAVKAYKKSTPDLVTLDLSLADNDGRQILAALKSADPKAKVLIISGNSQQSIKDSLVAAGAAAYLEKPIDFDALLALTARLCAPAAT